MIFCERCIFYSGSVMCYGVEVQLYTHSGVERDGVLASDQNKNNDCHYFVEKRERRWWENLLNLKYPPRPAPFEVRTITHRDDFPREKHNRKFVR